MQTETQDITTSMLSENLSKILDNWLMQKKPDNSLGLLVEGLASDIIFLTGVYDFIKEDRIGALVQQKATEGILNLQHFNSQTDLVKSTFCSGYTGFAFAIKHLVKEDIIDWDADLKNFFSSLDRTIYLSAMNRLGPEKNFDFLHGGIGNAIYLIDNVEEGINHEYVKEILDKIKDSAIKLKTGITFPYIDLSKKDPTNDIIYNSSLSHGISNMIYFFIQMIKKGFYEEEARNLLEQSLETLFYYSKENFTAENNLSYFIDTDKKGTIEFGKRLAWCYSDLGICSVLHQATDVLNNSDYLKKKIIGILLKTTERKHYKDHFIDDAAFCHGASGVAYMYFKFYKSMGRIEFKEASEYWQKILLSMANHTDDADGFKSWNILDQKWEKSFGLLEGTAGIGLTLASFIKDEPGSWDKIFLLS
jgi:hypothetical protein